MPFRSGMLRRVVLVGAVLLPIVGWLVTGLFVVGSREQAVVQIGGKLQTRADGGPVWRSPGLHLTWPWPLAVVHRLSLFEVETLTVKALTRNESDFLTAHRTDREAQFLTGDTNLLEVGLQVQYRLDPEQVSVALFGSEDRSARLRKLVTAELCALLAQQRVDDVHPTGVASLQDRLTQRLRRAVGRRGLGVLIEAVRIDEVRPPAQVKADFLAVTNARASQEQVIERARSFADRRVSLAGAEANRLRQQARGIAEQQLSEAQAKAAAFQSLLRSITDSEGRIDPEARRLAMRTQFVRTMSEVLSQVERVMLVDRDRTVDLSILPDQTPMPMFAPLPPDMRLRDDASMEESP